MLQNQKGFLQKDDQDVKEADSSRWYSSLTRISNYDKEKHDQLQIDEINHLTDQEQAEAIADSINQISKEYEEVDEKLINIPEIPPGSTPQFTPLQIKKISGQGENK